MHDHGGGFYALFLALFGCASIVLMAALVLPYRRPAAEAVPAE
jgi:hypothetical protein